MSGILRFVIVFATLATGAVASASEPLTVLVDPGHGGSNVGAQSTSAARITYEKNLTLQIARLVEKRLGVQGVRVILTRGRDRYLTLRQRARLAADVKADLFVSIHANASPQHNQRGIETYLLARESAEVDARRVAARKGEPTAALVAELVRLEAQRASARLAKAVQKRLIESRPAQNRGVRQGAYDVLAELSIPAILVEVGFIDHPIEGAELATAATQNQIAAAIAQGVLDYAGTDRRFAQASAPPPGLAE